MQAGSGTAAGQRDRDRLRRALREAIGREVRQLVRARAGAPVVFQMNCPDGDKRGQRHCRAGRCDISQRIAIDVGRRHRERHHAARRSDRRAGGAAASVGALLTRTTISVVADLAGAVGHTQTERQRTGRRRGECRRLAVFGLASVTVGVPPVCVHSYDVIVLLKYALLPEPFNVTVAPGATTWSPPATDVGRVALGPTAVDRIAGVEQSGAALADKLCRSAHRHCPREMGGPS